MPDSDSAAKTGPPDEVAAYRGLSSGWYRDKADPSMARYWDGVRLSEERRPVIASLRPRPSLPSVSGPSSTQTVQPHRPAGWYRDPSDSANVRYWDGESWTERKPLEPESPLAVAGTPEATLSASRGDEKGHHKRRWAVAATAALVVILGAGVIVFFGQRSNAQAQVISAANTAIGHKTARIDLNATVRVAGETVTLSGTGEVDFGRHFLEYSVPIESDGQEEQMKEVDVGSAHYEEVPGVSQVVPGKSWVSYDVDFLPQSGDQSTRNAALNDPSFAIRLLARDGNRVTSLNPSTVNGVRCQGYSVVINMGALRDQLDTLPSWMQNEIASGTMSSLHINVYVDGQGILRRESVAMPVTIDDHSAVAVGYFDFTDYGVPVNITAPPPNEVVGLQQFLQAIQRTTPTAE
jgi:Protein of unknown function (DUF2510)